MGLAAHIFQMLTKMSPQIKRTGLSDVNEMTVKKFWYQTVRPLPLNKRVKEKTPLHLLECSYMKAFRDFKKVHSEKIGYATFIKLKPKNVKKLRSQQFLSWTSLKIIHI